MKTSIDTLKTWFQTGDKPTEQQFANLIDSFHHKDSGDLITSYTVAANGDLSLTFSDGQTVTAEKFVLPNTMPLTFIDGLVAALNGKVDKVTGKQLTTNDFTTALKNKLTALTQYVHPNAHAISFITGLQDALDDKVDKVDGKALSDENYTDAEKQKLAGLQNYTHPATHPISEVAGLQAELDQIDQDLDDKVDKVDGKALSDENYTADEKQKLADLEQIWETAPNDSVKPKNLKQVAVNKNEAKFALDLASKTIETPLTGTVRSTGKLVVGTGTLFTTELEVGDLIEFDNGVTQRVISIISDEYAAVNVDGIAVTTRTAKKVRRNVANLDDALKVRFDEKGERYIEILAKILNKVGQTEYNYPPNMETKVILSDSKSYVLDIERPETWVRFKLEIIKENATHVLRVSSSNGTFSLSLTTEGQFYVDGLPSTATAGSNQLYKDSNGFLKIG